MKIAFQKVAEWEGKPHAEAELALRMLIAAESIHSLDAIASSDMAEIELFNPDIVIPLHFFIPKLFDAFTFGCMWNPLSAIEHNKAWDNIKSYDGYGVASDSQEQLINSIKFKSPSPYLVTEWYPSTNSSSYKKPINFSDPVYIGSGWGKNRHKNIFTKTNKIKVFGPRKAWKHLTNNIYCGEVPIDGKSLLNIYHEAGIGLALHHNSHNAEGLPSMRAFEIAASSSVMISDQNTFVQNNFGDNVLYLDTSLKPKEIAEQLDMLTNWIITHPQQAQEMAEASHNIFNDNFSLEVLLRNLIHNVTQFTSVNKLQPYNTSPEVEIIIRTDGNDKEKLFRALRSIEQQTYKTITVHIIYRGCTDKYINFQNIISDIYPNLHTKYKFFNKKLDRGSQFFNGLRSSSAEYIGFLDHDDELFSDHVEVLLNCLINKPDASLAYSGSIRIWEGDKHPKDESKRKLAYFYEQDKYFGYKPCITSNSYLVRKNKIPWPILNQPIPKMGSREDHIFLILMYDNSSYFIFSEKVTCAFYWRSTKDDNVAFDNISWDSSKITFNLIKSKATTKMSYTGNTHSTNYIIIHYLRVIFSCLKKRI